MAAEGIENYYREYTEYLITEMFIRVLEMYREKLVNYRYRYHRPSNLPPALEGALLDIFAAFSHTTRFRGMADIREVEEGILVHPNGGPNFLKDKYKEYYGLIWPMLHCDEDFLQWCCLCFLFSAQLIMRGFSSAIFSTVDAIFEITMNNGWLRAFKPHCPPPHDYYGNQFPAELNGI